MNRTCSMTGIIGLALLAGSCVEKTPNRDYYPAIKAQIVELQNAVKKRDRGPLEKLLTTDYAAQGGADSVVQFSFGTDPSFVFQAYSRAEIIYTNDRARVDCVVIDTAGQVLRPASLTFEHVNNAWLLKRIEPQLPPPVTDSVK
ncbi:MAG: hypothetical protein WAU88_10300 [Candidatus Zixiibacteriota bacterium]